MRTVCINRIKYKEFVMENGNSGNWNSGGGNSGNCNSGNENSGNGNSGGWNSGGGNSGNCNSGNGNSGNGNSGCLNSGGWNSGNKNSGGWNSGNNHTGCFNTTNAEESYYFNVLCNNKTWDKAIKPNWLYKPSKVSWVDKTDMTSEEKIENLNFHDVGGCLRINVMSEEWAKAYESASESEIQAVRDLPNFDYKVFEEITGLDLSIKEKSKDCDGKTVKIDGVTYTLNRLT